MTSLTLTVKFSFENLHIDLCAYRAPMQQFPKFIFRSTVAFSRNKISHIFSSRWVITSGRIDKNRRIFPFEICGHLLRYFTKITPQHFRTATDGGGSLQQRCFLLCKKLVAHEWPWTFIRGRFCGAIKKRPDVITLPYLRALYTELQENAKK